MSSLGRSLDRPPSQCQAWVGRRRRPPRGGGRGGDPPAGTKPSSIPPPALTDPPTHLLRLPLFLTQGASCGFGMRGQKSRAGSGVRPGFEGGQTPLYRRMPKLKGIAGGAFG